MTSGRTSGGRRLLICAWMTAAVLLTGTAACGGTGGHAIASDDAAARLDSLISQDRRVAEVAWSLALANQDLCPVVRPRAGWSLHAANQYGAALRPFAERRFGLDGDLPGVLAAPADSPAAAAGLGEGDLITAVNGRALEVGARSGAAQFDGLATNLALLDEAAGRGPMILSVRRNGHERTVTLLPVPACAYVTQIDASEGLSGRSDGRRIFISSGLAALAKNDDQLAFFLAHELAHAVLEHRTAPDLVGVRGEANSRITLRRGRSSSAEADADVMGLYLLVRAGYDPGAAVEALSAYAAAVPFSRFPQISPTGGDVYQPPEGRRRALASHQTEIARRLRMSEPLIP